jgi:hypothetical protein
LPNNKATETTPPLPQAMQVLLEHMQFVLLIHGVAAGETACFSDSEPDINFTKFTKINTYVNCVTSKVAKKHIHGPS